MSGLSHSVKAYSKGVYDESSEEFDSDFCTCRFAV